MNFTMCICNFLTHKLYQFRPGFSRSAILADCGGANVLLIENVRLSVDSSLFSRIFIKCGSLGGKQGTFV